MVRSAIAVMCFALTGCMASHLSGGLYPDCATPHVIERKERTEYPNVGMFFFKNKIWCTAFLVGPRLVATAGHCVEGETFYGSRNDVIVKFDGVPYYAEAYESSGTFGAEDIALVLLHMAPPESIPRLHLALTAAPPEATLVITGYGCNEMCTDADGERQYRGSGVQRSIEFGSAGFVPPEHYDSAWTVCKGDSGAPVWNRDTREVVAIVSGAILHGSGHVHRLVFADVVAWARRVHDQTQQNAQ